MGDVALPPLPPLPPPVGSGVRPSLSAGTPPPPTGPPPRVAAPAASGADDRYAPPSWLAKQKGFDRTNDLNPKVVILSIVGLVAVMVASGLVLALLIGTTDQRSVELEELNRPTFPDQEIFVDSMADPSAPIARPEGISVR